MLKTLLACLAFCALFSLFSFRCSKCTTGLLRIESGREWLPPVGTTQVTYVSSAGASLTTGVRVAEATEEHPNECGGTFQRESKTAAYYLDAGRTDSVQLRLGPPAQLGFIAKGGSTVLELYDLLNQGQRLSNFVVGTHSYASLVRVALNQNGAGIDSIYVAQNEGLVGFKYGGTQYALP